MIDAVIHYKSSSSKRQRMPAVPRPGEYLTHGGKVWKVDSILFSTPTTTWGKGSIDVYCIQIAHARREELERQWAVWSAKHEQ
jgi:hypothetical protein